MFNAFSALGDDERSVIDSTLITSKKRPMQSLG
jgi:hypothetical protein